MLALHTLNGVPNSRRSRETGQAALFLLLALGLFLLGGVGLAVDMAGLWMHRQASQNAADAACAAAAADLVNYSNGVSNTGGFTPGTAFNCSSNSSAAPCQYAGFNGYSATGLTANSPSTEVAISFPSSISGVQSCAASPTPSVCAQAGFPSSAFVRATVTDRTRTFLVGLLSGGTTMDVGATASCGAVLSNAPIPILVLDPRNEISVRVRRNADIDIMGGPQRSIQVNANSTNAIRMRNGSIDLTKAGPTSSGGDFAVTGGTPQTSGFITGSNGQWIDPTVAASDPLAQLAPPSALGLPIVPSDVAAIPGCRSGTQIAAGSCTVGSGVHGCPIGNCTLYTGGAYVNGITVGAGRLPETAIFDPGVYYVTNGLALQDNSCVRPSTSVGDGSGGTMFYFTDNQSIFATSQAGSTCTSTKVLIAQLQCINTGFGTTVLPADVIANGGLSGNVLLGPCQAPTSGGTNYGDPLGTNDPIGEQRGVLFFQNRDVTGVNATWDGASFGLAGIIYIHSCNNGAGNGSGNNCDTAAGYTDTFTLQGGSTTTYVTGDLVTDKLDLGNSQIEMDFNPNAVYYVLKASVLQ